MRMLAQEEMGLVAGGGIFDDIIGFFMADNGNTGDLGGPMQTVNVVGNKLSDKQAIAYDIQQLQQAFPNCTITFTVAPVVVSGTLTLTASSTSGIGGSAGGTVTRSTGTTVISCPPLPPGGGGNQQIR